MRPMSLRSDLEHEIWLLMEELTGEHGMTIQDAAEALRNAVRVNERDFKKPDAE